MTPSLRSIGTGIGRHSVALVRRLRDALFRRLDAVARAASRIPLPEAVTRRLRAMLRHPKPVRVEWDRLLLGDQGSLRGPDFARASGDLMWTSTRLADGPHVALFRSCGAALPDRDEVLATRYVGLARACIAIDGAFFGARTDDDLVDLVKEVTGHTARTARVGRRPSRPGVDGLPRVRPIRGSDCYQIVDGHHRLAHDLVGGASEAEVCVARLRGTTALQDLLARMTWLGEKREIYQPLDAPELQRSWTLVRACTDRWDKIRQVLSAEELPSSTNPRPTSLDIAAAQGWFVHMFREAGFEAEGVELDPLAPLLAEAAYRLPLGTIHTSEATEFLRGAETAWDVVTCFSLAHHFVLGRGPTSAEELLALLDRATNHVLFFETGHPHESWFGSQLREWTYDGVEAKLRQNTTFDTIVRLGTDVDGVGAYQGNYSRMLFACIRSGVVD